MNHHDTDKTSFRRAGLLGSLLLGLGAASPSADAHDGCEHVLTHGSHDGSATREAGRQLIRESMVTRMAGLPGATQQGLRLLQARSALNEFTFSTDDRGRVHLLGGDDLASKSAYESAARRGLNAGDDEWYAQVLRGFLVENQAVYLGYESLDRMDFLALEGAAPGTESGEVMVSIQQYRGGVRVKQGDLKALFINDSLVSVSGRMHDPVLIPEPDLRDVEFTLEGGPDLDLELLDTYFDTEFGCYLYVAREVADGRHQASEYLFDAGTGEYLLEREVGHAHDEVTKPFWTRDYPNAEVGDWSPSSGVRERDSIAHRTSSGVICRYEPNRAPGTLDYVDSCYYTLDKGKPSLPAYIDRFCGTISPFFSWVWPDYRFFVQNAAYYTNRAADMKNHPLSFFGFHQTRYPLELNVCNFNLGGAGIYDPGSQRISFEQPAYGQGGLPRGAEMLGTIIHEYGHYIHHAYGLSGTPDLIEGWADQVMHRWAVHQRFVTHEWPNMDYSSWGVRHGQQVSNGEVVVDNPTGDEGNFYWPGKDCNPNAWDSYGCGAVLSIVYWELAHDVCRTSHGDAYEGQDIIQAGPYQDWAWALANSAFAYAIAMSTSSTDSADFFDLVAQRYAQFEVYYSFLSNDDLWRVLSVLEHHCLGPSNRCQGWYRLPGSPLPASRTHKVSFYEAEDIDYTWGPTTHNESQTTSGDQFVRFGPWTYAGYNIQLPSAGTYRLKFITRPTSKLNGVLDVYAYDGQGWRSSAPAVSSSTWDWAEGPVIGPLSAGHNTIWLAKALQWGGYDLDAFVLEKL